MNKTRTITLSCINLPHKDEPTIVLFLNNTEVENIPDTGAAIPVISEETAKRAGLNVNPSYKNKVRVITADCHIRPKSRTQSKEDVQVNHRSKASTIAKEITNASQMHRK